MTMTTGLQTRKILAICAVFIHLCMVVPCATLAQELDVEGPVIVYAGAESSSTDTAHRFALSATDISGIKSVLLFHRIAGADEFTETSMTPVPGEPERFELEIEPDLDADDASSSLEYYIQVEDNVGNIVLKGFAFDPLVSIISLPVSTTVEDIARTGESTSGSNGAGRPASDQHADSPIAVSSGNRKLLYIALGVLGVGLVASLAGGDDSGSATDDCTIDSGCRLTVNVPVPQ